MSKDRKRDVSNTSSIKNSADNLESSALFSPPEFTPTAQPVQRQSISNKEKKIASKGSQSSNALPENLQQNMEAMSGMDLSDVNVHRNSGKPAQLQAEAYAQGSDIHLAPGKEQHLPHEAWHVVQQKQGRVQANTNIAGQGVNDSEALESEADRMGEKAKSSVNQSYSQIHQTQSSSGEAIQMWNPFKKKKKENSSSSPNIENMEQLGGTASDVYRAKLSGGMGEYGSDVAFVKKALRSVDTDDASKEEVEAINRVANNPGGVFASSAEDVQKVYAVYNRSKQEGKNNIGGATTSNVNINGISLSDVADRLGMSPEDRKAQGINAMQAPELLLEDPRLLARAVASSRLDNALGTNVLSQESFGTHNGETVGLSSEVKGGKALSEKVDLNKGSGGEKKEATVKTSADWQSAKMQRGMSNLTLMDALTGQQDRHAGNIMVDPSGEVKGIDNDMAFGTKNNIGLKNIKSSLFTENKDKNGKVKSLNYRQELIDEETGKAILKMSERQFKKTLEGDKNDPQSLNENEIEAALMRFRAIKKQVRLLKKQKKLVKNWDASTYAKMMTEGKDEATGGMVDNPDAVNYLARSVNDYNSADDQVGENSSYVKESAYNNHLESKKRSGMNKRVMGRKMAFEQKRWQQAQAPAKKKEEAPLSPVDPQLLPHKLLGQSPEMGMMNSLANHPLLEKLADDSSNTAVMEEDDSDWD